MHAIGVVFAPGDGVVFSVVYDQQLVVVLELTDPLRRYRGPFPGG